MPLEVEQVWTSVWHRVHKERVLKNAVEVSKHLDDHWGGSIHLSRLEQIGGCRWTTIDYPKHHAFAIHSRPKCWKPNRLQRVWPCQLCCTRNVFRMGGTKADQEELQCHHPELTENIWKPCKLLSYGRQSNTMPGLVLDRFCSRWQIRSKLTNSQFNMFKHVLVKTCQHN